MMITAEVIFKSAAALGAKRSVDDYCILIEKDVYKRQVSEFPLFAEEYLS